MTVVALIALALAGRAVFVYFHPMSPCRWCRGRGTNLFSTTMRYGKCRHCRGTKATERIGSRSVRRVMHGKPPR
jgi:hypothetical protein